MTEDRSDRPAPDLVVAGEARVVGGLLGGDGGGGVALPHRGLGDLDESGPGAELLDGAGAAIPHAGPQPADELEDEIGQRSLVGGSPLDPLGDELLARGG